MISDLKINYKILFAIFLYSGSQFLIDMCQISPIMNLHRTDSEYSLSKQHIYNIYIYIYMKVLIIKILFIDVII